ncbi:DEAD/DEAH box helicase [Chitinophaga sp. NPDC101104]|uniref:DEAD/DEAH box helicase n=1 Tax=Chitinophaga sp. NPDC101104 TaxID=3390561 RepID=UPI003D03A990
MDKFKEATTVVASLGKWRRQQIEDHQMIKIVCGFFDAVKDQNLNEADRKFMKYISNLVGIPHYYDQLEKYNQEVDISSFDLNTIGAIFHESSLHTDDHRKVHRYQKYILDQFKPGTLNRYFVSASTSFGKTHLVYEILRKMKYQNIILIFPTVALLSENLERMSSDALYADVNEQYSLHTLSEVSIFSNQNIFIYTPERFLSFIEKNPDYSFDFAFVDEAYKIDNDYLIDEQLKENERDVAYRLAVFYLLNSKSDNLLAGPYIDFQLESDPKYNPSFNNFLRKNKVELIDLNKYEIVNKTYKLINSAKKQEIDEHFSLEFLETSKEHRIIKIAEKIVELNENVIMYCSARAKVESYAKKLISSTLFQKHDFQIYSEFIRHIETVFSPDWIVVKALKNGIGIHHGLVPKYIQKETISLFNRGQLKILVSTTTITEGVNTSARNLVVLHSKKGRKQLRKFDAKNIAGRAGRFMHHYSGRVLVLDKLFMDIIVDESQGIKHKNYDSSSPKDEIDLFYTDDEYLNEEDRRRSVNVAIMQTERGLPDFLFALYKVVSRVDKMIVYDEISKLTPSEFKSIRLLIQRINGVMNIDNDGFEAVLKVIYPVIKNENLKALIDRKDKNGKYSILTHLIHFYLAGGFTRAFHYRMEQGISVDEAIRTTADFVYNLLKYQVVKYLGVFNIMYKYFISLDQLEDFEEVTGIDRLLTKLEYNALTDEGRIASDYGVPSKVVDYYENGRSATIRRKFDNYERAIFGRIDAIINKGKQSN